MIGRTKIVCELAEHARLGHAIVIHGAPGCGVSTILDAVARELGDRPIARVSILRERADLTEALARAYGGDRPTQRAARAHALDLARRRPGAVLVDRAVSASPAVRADIRSLGAVGTGAVIAVAVSGVRDHARMRAMRLAHRELAIPPLTPGQLRKVFDASTSVVVVPEDVERVVKAADGRPGLVAKMATRLSDGRYWSRGRVMVEALRADVVAG